MISVSVLAVVSSATSLLWLDRITQIAKEASELREKDRKVNHKNSEKWMGKKNYQAGRQTGVFLSSSISSLEAAEDQRAC